MVVDVDFFGPGLQAVDWVDSQSGRTMVCGAAVLRWTTQGNCRGTLIGAGPVFVSPRAIAVEDDGSLVVRSGRRGGGARGLPRATARCSPMTGVALRALSPFFRDLLGHCGGGRWLPGRDGYRARGSARGIQ